MNNFPYKHITVIVSPTDYCNMNCIYCFNGRRTMLERKTISEGTLRKVFEITIPYYSDIKFLWHGGEPLSMGQAFYEKVISLQKEINTTDAHILNTMQSNLTLLDEDFAKFLIKNKFGIGGSFDGTQNEKTRHCSAQILAGHNILTQCGGTSGFICVVQAENINHLIEDYEWFKSQGINYTLNQYLSDPCQNGDPLYVPPGLFSKRMSEFFDYWFFDDGCKISVTYFQDMIDFILFKSKKLCCYSSCLGKYVGIRYDGSIYPCNRDFDNKYFMGNVYNYTDIHECFDSEGFRSLLSTAIRRRSACKGTCSLYDFCEGGCNSAADMAGDVSKPNTNVCQSLTYLFEHVRQVVLTWVEKDIADVNTHLNPTVVERIERYKHGKSS